MPQVVTAGAREDNEYNLLEEGDVVTASVLDLQEVPSSYKDDDGKTKQQFQWDFVVTDEGPYKGRRVRSWTSTNFTAHPNCKAYTWSKAIMRKDFNEGESFDTDDLIGQSCRIVIGVTPDAKWNRVSNVLPTREGSQMTTSESPVDAPF